MSKTIPYHMTKISDTQTFDEPLSFTRLLNRKSNETIDLSTKQLDRFFQRIEKTYGNELVNHLRESNTARNKESSLLNHFGLENSQLVTDYLNTPTGETTKQLIYENLLELAEEDEKIHEEMEEEVTKEERVMAYMLMILARHHAAKTAELYTFVEEEIQEVLLKQRKLPETNSVAELAIEMQAFDNAEKALESTINERFPEGFNEGEMLQSDSPKHIFIHEGKEYVVDKSIDTPEKFALLSSQEKQLSSQKATDFSKKDTKPSPHLNHAKNNIDNEIVNFSKEKEHAELQSQMHIIQAAKASVQNQITSGNLNPTPSISSSKAGLSAKVNVSSAATILRILIQNPASTNTAAAKRFVRNTYGPTGSDTFANKLPTFRPGLPMDPRSLTRLIKLLESLGAVEAKRLEQLPNADRTPEPDAETSVSMNNTI